MVIISDRTTGTFLFARERERGGGSVVIQVWAPYDYLTLGWDAIHYAWGGEPNSLEGTVAAGWTLDEYGEERELPLKMEEEHAEVGNGGAQLILVDGFPRETPPALREAVKAREAAKREAWRATATVLDSAVGHRVWIRLVGGAAMVGRLERATARGVNLKKPLRWEGAGAEKLKSGYVANTEIVAAKDVGVGRRRLSVPGPEFGAWMKETDEASTTPQLRTALCPGCINAVKPPWRSGLCSECRAGRRRDIPDSFYFPSDTATGD